MSEPGDSSLAGSSKDASCPPAADRDPVQGLLEAQARALEAQCRELARRNAELTALREQSLQEQARLEAANQALAAELAERDRAQHRLRTLQVLNQQSADRFQRLFEEVAEGIAVLDVEAGLVVDCNRAFLRLTGWNRAELLGLPFLRLHPDAQGERLADDLRRALEAGGGRSVETRLVNRSGESKEIEIRLNPVTLGERRYLQGLYIDLTEQRRMEREREATVELLRLLNQPSRTHELLALVARFLRDWTGCEAVGIRLREGDDFPYFETLGFSEEFVRKESSLCLRDACGQVLCDALGHPRLECMCGTVLAGRTDPALPYFTRSGSFWTNGTTELLAATTPEQRQGATRNRCNGQSYESVALIPMRSGETVLGLIQLNDRARGRFTPELIQFLERTGHQLGLALAQRQAREALRASEKRFRDLSEAASDFLWETEADASISFVTDRIREVLGYEPAELVGQSIYALVPQEDHEAFHARHGIVEDFRNVELRLLARDGRRVWVSVTRIRKLDAQGGFLGYRGAGVEITERKRAEAQIRRMNEELELQVQRRTTQFEAANRELEAFSYSVSHDLRAPLRAIDGFSQVLLEDYGGRLDEEGRRYLQRVRQGTQRMGHLIEDLLKLSRLSRGDLETGPLDLSAEAGRILRELALGDPHREVRVQVQPGLCAVGDARLVQIALENLLGNAWKYTGLTPDACIEFGCRHEDGSPVFFVRDNGAGFDMAYSGKLFSPFQRLHSEPHFEGSGIGLALAQRILHRHGGRIWAQAAPGQGATFFFTLPDPAPR